MVKRLRYELHHHSSRLERKGLHLVGVHTAGLAIASCRLELRPHLRASVVRMSTSSHIYALLRSMSSALGLGGVVESPEVNHDYSSSSNSTSALHGVYLHTL